MEAKEAKSRWSGDNGMKALERAEAVVTEGDILQSRNRSAARQEPACGQGAGGQCAAEVRVTVDEAGGRKVKMFS